MKWDRSFLLLLVDHKLFEWIKCFVFLFLIFSQLILYGLVVSFDFVLLFWDIYWDIFSDLGSLFCLIYWNIVFNISWWWNIALTLVIVLFSQIESLWLERACILCNNRSIDSFFDLFFWRKRQFRIVFLFINFLSLRLIFILFVFFQFEIFERCCIWCRLQINCWLQT